jgi:hypothetical protein
MMHIFLGKVNHDENLAISGLLLISSYHAISLLVISGFLLFFSGVLQGCRAKRLKSGKVYFVVYKHAGH